MNLVDPSSPPEDAAAKAPKRTAQVIRWEGVTRHDIPVERIIEAAADAQLQCAVILGYGPDGAEYFASSIADGADVLWLLERLKAQLLAGAADTDPV